jgi:hypothetical protein
MGNRAGNVGKWVEKDGESVKEVERFQGLKAA